MFLGDRKIGSSEAMESEPNGRQEVEGTVTKLRAEKEIPRRFSFFFFNRSPRKFVALYRSTMGSEYFSHNWRNSAMKIKHEEKLQYSS